MTTAHDPITLYAVKSAVARHLDLSEDEILDSHQLREELGLDALDLVLIVTRVEEELGVDVSLPHLEFVRTVSDLTGVIEDEDEPPTLRDPGAWPEDAHAP